MSECAHCSASCQLFLCGPCQTDLRDMLMGLVRGQELPSGHRAAGFIEYLEDARLGRTRLGESARRSTELSRPALARLTDNQQDSFKGSPSELFGEINNMLGTWVRHLCESRGIMV